MDDHFVMVLQAETSGYFRISGELAAIASGDCAQGFAVLEQQPCTVSAVGIALRP